MSVSNLLRIKISVLISFLNMACGLHRWHHRRAVRASKRACAVESMPPGRRPRARRRGCEPRTRHRAGLLVPAARADLAEAVPQRRRGQGRPPGGHRGIAAPGRRAAGKPNSRGLAPGSRSTAGGLSPRAQEGLEPARRRQRTALARQQGPRPEPPWRDRPRQVAGATPARAGRRHARSRGWGPPRPDPLRRGWSRSARADGVAPAHRLEAACRARAAGAPPPRLRRAAGKPAPEPTGPGAAAPGRRGRERSRPCSQGRTPGPLGGTPVLGVAPRVAVPWLPPPTPRLGMAATAAWPGWPVRVF
jgi:hypothetical protein